MAVHRGRRFDRRRLMRTVRILRHGKVIRHEAMILTREVTRRAECCGASYGSGSGAGSADAPHNPTPVCKPRAAGNGSGGSAPLPRPRRMFPQPGVAGTGAARHRRCAAATCGSPAGSRCGAGATPHPPAGTAITDRRLPRKDLEEPRPTRGTTSTHAAPQAPGDATETARGRTVARAEYRREYAYAEAAARFRDGRCRRVQPRGTGCRDCGCRNERRTTVLANPGQRTYDTVPYSPTL
jgi:hypothetical protein